MQPASCIPPLPSSWAGTLTMVWHLVCHPSHHKHPPACPPHAAVAPAVFSWHRSGAVVPLAGSISCCCCQHPRVSSTDVGLVQACCIGPMSLFGLCPCKVSLSNLTKNTALPRVQRGDWTYCCCLSFVSHCACYYTGRDQRCSSNKLRLSSDCSQVAPQNSLCHHNEYLPCPLLQVTGFILCIQSLEVRAWL